MSDIPDDFPFKDKMNYAGKGQGKFVGWACGGSHIVAPTSEYMVPPTFNKETIIYAELQAKFIKVVKSVFDSLGHYARWDLVNLTNPPSPYEPTTGTGAGAGHRINMEQIVDGIAKEFRLEPERVDAVVRGVLTNGSGNGAVTSN